MINPNTVSRNLERVLHELYVRRTLNKQIIEHLKTIAASFDVNVEKLAESVEQVDEEIQIVGGAIGQWFDKVTKFYEHTSHSMENLKFDMNNLKYLINDMSSLYGSMAETFDRIRNTLNLFSPTVRNVIRPVVYAVTFFSKLAFDFSRLAMHGLQFEMTLGTLELAQKVFIQGSYENTLELIRNNALIVQEYGLRPLENFIIRLRESSSRLYEYGFTIRDVTDLTFDVLTAQRLIMDFEQRQTVLNERFLIHYFDEMYKAAVRTGLSVSSISESIRKLAEDSDVRFLFTLVPANVQVALATISERFPEVFTILAEAMKKGFSIYRVDDLASIQMIRMDRKFQKWLDQIKEGTFTFEGFLKDMHEEVSNFDSFAKLYYFRGQNEAARLASILAYETRQTTIEANIIEKRQAVNEINQLMQNMNLTMLRVQYEFYNTLYQIVFSPEFDRFLGNLIDIFGTETEKTRNKLESTEEQAERILKTAQGDLISYSLTLGGIGFGGFKLVKEVERNMENVNYRALARPFETTFHMILDTINSAVGTITRTRTKLSGKLMEKASSRVGQVAEAVRRTTKIPFENAERLLKIRLGPLSIVLASISYWIDIVNLYSNYLEGNLTDEQFKVEFGKLLGKASGGLGGMVLLGALGAAAGSLLPGLGTGIGGFLGGMTGLFGGEYVGELLGEYIAQRFIIGSDATDELNRIRNELEKNAPIIKQRMMEKTLEDSDFVPIPREELDNLLQYMKKLNDAASRNNVINDPTISKETMMLLNKLLTEKYGKD